MSLVWSGSFLFLVAAEGLNLLAKKAVSEGLLDAAKVGREGVVVSHIQYADDTLFIVDGSEENAEAVKWILKSFEVISGLGFNFDKSCMFGINVVKEKLEDMAAGWGCKVGVFPVPYLGLKVGGRINGVESWSEVVEKVKRRVRKWEVKMILLGGRITVVKAILTAMPLYNLSFLPLPKKVENILKSIQSNLLWGGENGSRKVAWIRWEDIC